MSIFLLPTNLQFWAFLISGVVLLLLIYWEIKNDRRVVLRIFLSLIAVGSLLLVALQPSKQVVQDKTKAIFLTENYDEKKLDSLLVKYPKAKVIAKDNLRKDSLVMHDTLHILGDGFRPFYFPDSLNIPIVFSANSIPEGITDFHFTKKVVVQESIKLQGKFYSTDTLPKRVLLKSPKGEEELKIIRQKGLFEFNVQQKTVKDGRFLYTVLVEKADSIIQEEVFPIIVHRREKLKVFILNEAPSFETKYLKNWLLKGGHSIAVRSTVSKEKYNTEFVNFPEMDLTNLNQNLLKKLDVLVVQATTIHQLKRAELNALKKWVERGLGLIILPDERLFLPQLANPFQSFFFDFNYQKKERKELTINHLLGRQKEVVALNCFPYQANKRLTILPIIEDIDNAPIAVVVLKNQGRISSSVIPITYTLQLKGKSELYNVYWSELFKATVPNNFVENSWQVQEELLAQPNAVVNFNLSTSEVLPVAFIANEEETTTPIYLQQNPLNREQWQGTFWPPSAGWYSISTEKNKDDIDWLFVPQKAAWKAMHLSRQRQSNLDWLETQNAQWNKKERPVILERKRLPLWWFYVSFLIGIGGLWLEEKF